MPRFYTCRSQKCKNDSQIVDLFTFSGSTCIKAACEKLIKLTTDVNKQFRTRIARTTDPIYVEKRRSRQPRAYDVACQTDPNTEFGLLSEYLRKV